MCALTAKLGDYGEQRSNSSLKDQLVTRSFPGKSSFNFQIAKELL